MELSRCKLKKFLIIFQKKKNSYISGKGTVYPQA